MNIRVQLCVSTIVVAYLLGHACAMADSPNQPTSREMNDVIQAWRSRMSRFEAVRIKYETTGGVTDGVTIITLQGQNMRHHWVGEVTVDGSRLYQDVIHTYDGNESLGLRLPVNRKNNSEAQYPNGMLHNNDRPHKAGDFHMRIVAWTFAPLLPAVTGFRIDELQVRESAVPLDGRTCIVLEHVTHPPPGFAGDPIFHEFWLDPDIDYSLVRYRQGQGHVNAQIDTRYERHDSQVFLPREWTTFIIRSDGTIAETRNTRVLECELNPHISSEEFRVKFPPYTIVSNMREGGGLGYMTRPDGSKRPILESEWNLSYEDMVAQDKRRQAGSHRKWLLAAIALIALSSAAIWFSFRRGLSLFK